VSVPHDRRHLKISLQKADITRCTLEAACWRGLECWSN